MLYGQVKIGVQTFEESPLWQRPVSGIAGRAFSPLYAAMMANEDFLKPGPGKAQLDDVAKYYPRDKHDKENDIELAMYANDVHPIENLKRTWQRKDLGITGKVLGSLYSPVTDALTSLTRADHYNPFAHSITSFTNNPAIKFHEMGHAEDFSKREWKTPYTYSRLLYPMTLYQEYQASKNAGKPLNKYISQLPAEEREAATNKSNATLNAGFASYATQPLGPAGALIAPMLGVGGRLLGASNWSGKQRKH